MSNPLPPLVPDSFSGRRLGKYEIVCRLSTGGMSVIFLAFTRGVSGFRKYVVLKQILPDVKGEDEFVRMFLDEAKITAAFQHPHIAQVFDLDVAEGELFLTMEFVPGATLVEVARACRAAREPIPMGLTLQSVRDTAVALHYAHTFTDPFGNPQPVIHRDIAEKNIMVTYEGVTKLLDFGIAKSLKGQSRTSVGMVKGTSGYMSPEQIRGEKLDARTDIFSLGVVLHELLTGVRLFAARSTEEALVAPLQQVVEPPSRQNPEVAPELDAVVMRCLERDRAARFATSLELARALERSVRPGTLWHPEESAAFMQRIFSERREQTRALLSSSAAPSPSEIHQVPPTPAPRPAVETAPLPVPPPVAEAPVLEPASEDGGYADDELPDPVSPQKSAQEAITSDATGPTQAPVNRPVPGIKRRTSPARPNVRSPAPTAAPARTENPAPPPQPAAVADSPLPGAAEQKSSVALYAGLGTAVLAAFGVAGWLLFANNNAPSPAPLPQVAVRPEPKPAAPQGRMLVPPEPTPPPGRVLVPPEPTLPDAGTPPVEPPRVDAGAGAPTEVTPPAPPGQPQVSPVQPARTNPVATPQPQSPPARTQPGQKPLPPPTQPAALATATQPAGGLKRPQRKVEPSSTSTGDGSGFLTLVTIPAELKVMLGARVLGETPLVKFPLPEGTHQLRLLGGDGQSTGLSVSIRDGETTAVRKTISAGE